jgi:hypothetical protein
MQIICRFRAGFPAGFGLAQTMHTALHREIVVT